MTEMLKLHLITLPRWFGLPAVAAAVTLGGLLVGDSGVKLVLALASAAFLMAWAHSMNTYLDYVWTGLDKGEDAERSKPKAYTSGQQPIAAGLLTPGQVLLNATFWLVLSLAGTAVLVTQGVSTWIWLPWVLIALCTFGYSWGKLHYLCELVLGLGFGSFAVMYGATLEPVTSRIMLNAALAGLPFVFLWGYAAEFYDQAFDAEPNWPRGLRNLGAWAWRSKVNVPLFLLVLVVISYVTQLFVIQYGALAPETMLTLLAVPFFAYGAVIEPTEQKRGVLILLFAIFMYMVALVVGQAIA